MKKNPQDRQIFIYKELEKKPTIKYLECFAIYKQSFAVSRRTFDSDWQKANEKYNQFRAGVEEKRKNEIAKLELESNDEILTLIEAQKLLTKIARGVIEEIDEEKIVPSFKERISAISELSKMLKWQDIQNILSVQNMQINNNNFEVNEKFFGNFIIEVDERGV